ncbi:hypothetical protein C4K18_3315 [Pseudomonas chlororaphis subsp. aurantiaca]|nr:hypothetical protein C4K18_3315 [Pseudomonas chlororaphis subsp. aurantiaca]
MAWASWDGSSTVNSSSRHSMRDAPAAASTSMKLPWPCSRTRSAP